MSQVELTTEYIEIYAPDRVDVDEEVSDVVELGVPGGVGPQGLQGPQGPQGLQGPPGNPGGAGLDLSYVFNQQIPASQWIVVHNLGKQPAVEIVDSAGSTVVGDVVHDSIYQMTINFTAPFAGTAYLN